MREIIAALMVVSLIFAGGCTAQETKPKESADTVGVWISYSEIDSMVRSPEGFEENFSAAVDRCAEIGINTVYFHAVAFCDATYASEIYPSRHGQDLLKTAIELCEERGIALHAWLNPYRVQTSSASTETLRDGFVQEWLSDSDEENDKNVCFTSDGIYLNPASSRVKNIILSAVREILTNYRVAGIQYDDYFYPTVAESFDEDSYKAYTSGTETPLELSHWRRQNVNSLILCTYNVVKAAEGDRIFGVSPAADLERCYNELYADVETWVSGGYVDYILPQLYFGFEYPNERFQFESLMIKWLDIAGEKTRLIIGLPMYKTATVQEPDITEWQASNDIVARQIECVRKYKAEGFAFFSLSSLFSDSAANREQLQNIKEVI